MPLTASTVSLYVQTRMLGRIGRAGRCAAVLQRANAARMSSNPAWHGPMPGATRSLAVGSTFSLDCAVAFHTPKV
jgi:hypothetical protein